MKKPSRNKITCFPDCPYLVDATAYEDKEGYCKLKRESLDWYDYFIAVCDDEEIT